MTTTPSALRLRRLALGLTLFDVTTATRILGPRLSLIERGRVVPKPDERRRLSTALLASEADLFPAETSNVTAAGAA